MSDTVSQRPAKIHGEVLYPAFRDVFGLNGHKVLTMKLTLTVGRPVMLELEQFSTGDDTQWSTRKITPDEGHALLAALAPDNTDVS